MIRRKIKFINDEYVSVETGEKNLLSNNNENSKEGSKNKKTTKPHVEIDVKTIAGLKNVSSPDVIPQEDKNANPQFVMFSLEDHSDTIADITTLMAVPNPFKFEAKILHDDRREPMSYFIERVLKEHIKKYGTIKEIVIAGHGVPGTMNAEDGYHKIFTNDVLYNIAEIEKETGIKVTDRIVFAGCRTFSELEDEEIRLYRNYATLHVEMY